MINLCIIHKFFQSNNNQYRCEGSLIEFYPPYDAKKISKHQYLKSLKKKSILMLYKNKYLMFSINIIFNLINMFHHVCAHTYDCAYTTTVTT